MVLFSINAVLIVGSTLKKIPCPPFNSVQFFTLPPLWIMMFCDPPLLLILTLLICTSPIPCVVTNKPISVKGPGAGTKVVAGGVKKVSVCPAPIIVIPLLMITCSA